MIASNTDPRYMPASFLSAHARDPATGTSGPPNYGRQTVPHIFTISARYGLSSKSYQWADEAMRHDKTNAEAMRSECGIMECLEGRQRGTSLLKWHVQPQDEQNSQQKYMAKVLTDILERIPRFTELRRNLLEALWYGRYMTAHQFSKARIAGQWRTVMNYWEPRNGDKLVFRYDDGTYEYDPRQVGIRVGAGYGIDSETTSPYGIRRRKVEATQYGLVYWLDDHERKRAALHKHMIEDGPFDDYQRSGAIHGVGIRDRIYWTWYGMQECLAHLLEYLERTALGIEIWNYPANNPVAEAKTRKAAEERMGGGRNMVLVPVFPGDQQDVFGVQHIEPGLGGVEALKDIIQNYFGAKIKRYILGQTLTTEAESTGLGSGVADAHLATFADIITYDAVNLSETITNDIVRPLQLWNFPGTDDVLLRFVIDTDAPDSAAKLQAAQQAWAMGLKIRAEDIYGLIGFQRPSADDDVLENPQLAAGAMGEMGLPGVGGMPGAGPQGPGAPGGDPSKPSGPEDGPEQAANETDGNAQRDKYGASESSAAQLERLGDEKPASEKAPKVDAAAAEAARDPSDPQREAGNYRHGHVWLHGLHLSIENEKGTRRRPEWPPLSAHYGYIRGTTGKDGDHVDCYLGPHPESEIVYVIDQVTEGGRFDEHKVVLGVTTEKEARDLYLANYSAGWKCGEITAMTIGQFRAWLDMGNTKKAVAGQVSKYAAKKGKAAAGSLWKEEEHPRDESGQFTSGEGKGASIDDAPFSLERPKEKKDRESPFETNKGKQSVLWRGLKTDLPGQMDMFEEQEAKGAAEKETSAKEGDLANWPAFIRSLDANITPHELNRALPGGEILVDVRDPETIRANYAHEVGHNVHDYLMTQEQRAEWKRTNEEAAKLPYDKKVSARGTSGDPLEDFPEVFAAWTSGDEWEYDRLRAPYKEFMQRHFGPPAEIELPPQLQGKPEPDKTAKRDRTGRKINDALEGGKADDKPASDFDPEQLDKGQAVEREHTSDPATAQEIAKDHLAEDAGYYDKLEQVEGASDLSDSERTRKDLEANFSSVTDNPSAAKSRDLHRARMYADKVIGHLQRQAQSGEIPQSKARDLIDSLGREMDGFAQILKQRGDYAGGGPYSDERQPAAKPKAKGQASLFSFRRSLAAALGVAELTRYGRPQSPERYSWNEQDHPRAANGEFAAKMDNERGANEQPDKSRGPFVPDDETTYWRIHWGEFTGDDLHDEHKSRLWYGDDEDTTRSGLSVAKTLADLVDYFAGDPMHNSPGRSANFNGAHLVQLRGLPSGDTPYEEHYGEELINPTDVIASVPVEETDFLKRLEKRVGELFEHEYKWDGSRLAPIATGTGDLADEEREYLSEYFEDADEFRSAIAAPDTQKGSGEFSYRLGELLDEMKEDNEELYESIRRKLSGE